MKYLFLSLLFVLFSFRFFGQTVPEKSIVFDDSELPIIKISLEQDSLDELLMPGNEYSDHEYPAQFIFIHSQETDTLENVGFRLRGNTSRISQKKSFKVAFNSFSHGRNFYGLEKLNLNGEHNDPSIIRTKLCSELFRDLGVPASRTNHVKLYVNGEYKGLYMNVEHIDEEFAELRFNNKNGNLYKCLWPADLDYIDNNSDSYKLMDGDRRVYELKTNEETDDYTDLANFIDILNNTPPENLPDSLEPVFSVNAYLKELVVEILAGHWDGYSYNKNNFYLYHNQLTGKFEFIPYDVDNTFGIDWFNIDWAIRNIYSWAHDTEPRPLTARLLQNQVYKDRFSFFLDKALTAYFAPDTIFPKIDSIKNRMSSAAEDDTYRTLDYGWTFQDFNDSYMQALGAHVKYGLKPYITTRFNNANTQIILNSVAPIISRVEFTHLFAGRDFELFATVDDEDSNLSVSLHYHINSDTPVDLIMNDDGTGNDSVAGDHIYSGFIASPLTGPGTFQFNISATDADVNTSYDPINGMYTLRVPEQSEIDLYINEFMASNSNTIADEFGEYDDWVEIYNAGNESVWLGNKYLSDDRLNPSKWQMPDVEIHAEDFLLFWTDNDTEQGDYHTNFKLSAGGEEIGIFDSESTGFAEIDFVAFGEQTTDISTGRIPDGTGDISVLTYATPGYSNTSEISVISLNRSIFKVCPNPFNRFLYLSFVDKQNIKKARIQLTDISGKIISQKTFFSPGNSVQILSGKNILKPGFYILSIEAEDISGNTQKYNSQLVIKK